MDNFFDNKRILTSVWKWKFHILVAITIAIVVSALISGPNFIKPKFMSSARLYPVNIEEASEESESEHLLEYLQSTDIKFRVIDAFKLDEVYKINKEDKLYQTYILTEYNKNIKYKKTDFESVEISVLDTDPYRSRDMVDSIVVFLNDKIQTEKAKVYFETASIYKRALDSKRSQIDSLAELVDKIRAETGLIDYEIQAETVTQGLMFASAFGGDRKPAEKTIEQLIMHGGELRKNQELIEQYESQSDTLKSRHDRYYNLATSNIHYSKVVEYPFPADKKTFPVRWLIVLLSTLATAFFSIIAVSLIDYARELKES
jgi:capsular polysaccharide biosynthesis protein